MSLLLCLCLCHFHSCTTHHCRLTASLSFSFSLLPTPPRLRNIPRTTRLKWLRRLQHAKVSYAFAGHCHRSLGGGKAFPGAVVKYKPKKVKAKKGAAKTEGEGEGEGAEESQMDVSLLSEPEPEPEPEPVSSPPAAGVVRGADTEKGSSDGPKPGSNGSKVPASASASAITDHDASVSVSVSVNDGDSKDNKKEGEGDGHSSDDDDDDDYDDEGHGSEDDDEHDWGYAPDERDDDGKVAFKNVQRDYQGPTVVVTNSVGQPLDDGAPGIRLVLVREMKISHKYYGLDALPKEVVVSSGRLP